MSESVSRPFLVYGVFGAFGLVALLWGSIELNRYLTTSPRFAIREIAVVTEGPARAEDVLRASGVKKGMNLFLLDLDDSRAGVEKIPWVHHASVSRVLPGRVEIRYVPQTPVAILGLGSLYYLNAEGIPFQRVDRGGSAGLPIIQVERGSESEDVPAESVRRALELIGLFRGSSLFVMDDLADVTVRGTGYQGAAPLVTTLAFPPFRTPGSTRMPKRFVPVTWALEDLEQQLRRVERVALNLAQAGKNPRLIRLELGKKIVVKTAQ
ncbi:MAG: FtsQ-type POTRA domain-containing protein [Bdellovibrionales bacterium]|nr:FtsQ-type POTRA domain-containing protein [Bdellovibrionales bacterium]